MEANNTQLGKQRRSYQSQTLYTPVTCHLPCAYISSGTRLKLDSTALHVKATIVCGILWQLRHYLQNEARIRREPTDISQ